MVYFYTKCNVSFFQHDSCPVCRLSLSNTQTRGSRYSDSSTPEQFHLWIKLIWTGKSEAFEFFFCYNLVLSYWVHHTIETIWDAVNISTVFLLEQQLCFFIIKFIYRSQLLLLFVMSVNKNVSIRLWNIGISGSLEAVN